MKKQDEILRLSGKLDLDHGGETAVLPADVDGDANIDLLVPDSGCPDLHMLLGNGAGAFLARPPLRFGIRAYTAAAADWDGDGSLDVAASGYTSGVHLLLQRPSTVSEDCDHDGVPDECQGDCNRNGLPDSCDIASGASADCDRNGVPDDCDPDCDRDGVPDECAVGSGAAGDCDADRIPDTCELEGHDGDGDGALDDCQIASGDADCNRNEILDSLDLKPYFAWGREEYRLSEWPESLALADLDADEDLDVVASDWRDGVVATLETRPGGRLAGPHAHTLDAPARGVAIVDADGDGLLDCATVVEDSTCGRARGWVALLENRGGRRLGRGAAYPLEGAAGDLAAGDFDGDRRDDLIAFNRSTGGSIWWLRGLGTNDFALPARIADYAGPLAVADFDRDGDDDVAPIAGPVLLGGALGAFVKTVPPPITGSRLQAGDLDGDGDSDLKAEGPSGISLALNRGDATFVARDLAISEWIPEWSGGSSLLADVHGDGLLDILTGSLTGLVVLRNVGEAVFHPEPPIPGVHLSRHMASGDLERDGDVDLVGTLAQSGSALVVRGTAGGGFVGGESFLWGQAQLRVEAADLDGDGDLDLAGQGVSGPVAHLVLLENDGRGSFLRRGAVELDRTPLALRAVDLNGDGRPDLITTELIPGGQTSGVSLFLNQGGWVYKRGQRLTAGQDARSLAAEDLDGDGDRDLVILNRESRDLSIFWNAGRARFESQASVPLDGSYELLVAAKIDGDALPDLLVGRPGPPQREIHAEIAVFHNAGAGVFVKGNVLGTYRFQPVAVAGDLDGDGDNDVVYGPIRDDGWCDVSPDDCERWMGVAFNDGRGNWERVVRYPAGARWLSLALADLEGDSDLDVVASFQALNDGHSPALATFLNEGHGSLVQAAVLSTGPSDPGSLTLADFNGDQRPELIAAGGGMIFILQNRTQPPASADADGDAIPDECRPRPFRRGDLDGSGEVDLSDAVSLLRHLFLGGEGPVCPGAADFDDDGAFEITEAVGLLRYLFLSGPGPAAPGAERCGPDPTPDDLGPCLSQSC